MMDTILTLPLELMLLTVAVGVGALYIFRTRSPATIDTIDSVVTRPHDMRFDGQLLAS